MAILEAECRDVAITRWGAHGAISRSFERHRVFLHLYADRRRVGDVQFYMDQMDPPTAYTLHVVSLSY